MAIRANLAVGIIGSTAKAVVWVALATLALGAFGGYAFAQQPAAATDDKVLSKDELNELVGKIALYPDDLVAIVLPASTYPLQVVEAARFLEERKKDPSLKPSDKWDDSVVALLNYPEVVKLMNNDLDWTWKLGDAVINQRGEVLDAIQGFRTQAAAAGNLHTDEHQVVQNDDQGEVSIKPADPQVVYVPYYDPQEVVVSQPTPVYYYYPYGYPLYYYPYPYGYPFAAGYFWGVTTAFVIGWHSHYVHVVHCGYSGHPYYGHTYYGGYYVRRDVNTAVSRGNYVWEPHYRTGGQPFTRSDGRQLAIAHHDPRAGGAPSGYHSADRGSSVGYRDGHSGDWHGHDSNGRDGHGDYGNGHSSDGHGNYSNGRGDGHGSYGDGRGDGHGDGHGNYGNGQAGDGHGNYGTGRGDGHGDYGTGRGGDGHGNYGNGQTGDGHGNYSNGRGDGHSDYGGGRGGDGHGNPGGGHTGDGHGNYGNGQTGDGHGNYGVGRGDGHGNPGGGHTGDGHGNYGNGQTGDGHGNYGVGRGGDTHGNPGSGQPGDGHGGSGWTGGGHGNDGNGHTVGHGSPGYGNNAPNVIRNGGRDGVKQIQPIRNDPPTQSAIRNELRERSPAQRNFASTGTFGRDMHSSPGVTTPGSLGGNVTPPSRGYAYQRPNQTTAFRDPPARNSPQAPQYRNVPQAPAARNIPQTAAPQMHTMPMPSSPQMRTMTAPSAPREGGASYSYRSPSMAMPQASGGGHQGGAARGAQSHGGGGGHHSR